METWEQSFRFGGIVTAGVHPFLLRRERLEGRVLRCKPMLVTLRITPSLAAVLAARDRYAWSNDWPAQPLI